MTPQEKAEEVFKKFADIEHLGVYGNYEGTWEWSSSLWRQQAKEAALIAVDEIIEAMEFNSWQNRNEIEYYQEVKEEINKL